MRIVETTPDRLTLESRPWALGIALTLAILIFTGLALASLATEPRLAFGMALGAVLIGAMFVVFVRRVRVILDHPAGAVAIRTATVVGQTERILRLSDITAAGVETTVSRSTRSSNAVASVNHTHRPVLKTATGDVPLTLVYSSGDGAARMAEAINRWLGRP